MGETERRLQARVKGHRRTSSPVGFHADFNQHTIDDSAVSVLHKEIG